VKYLQSTPLTRVVDAAYPESIESRNFAKMVDSFCKSQNEEDWKKISDKLFLWKNNHEYLLLTINKSPILKEITSQSEDLSMASELGLQALQSIESCFDLGQNWYNESKQKLENAKKPRGQVELKVIDPIEKLVNFTFNKE
jgi:hypothetical protein